MISFLVAACLKHPQFDSGFVKPLSEMVVYEENLRAEGTDHAFAALADRLDSIKELGVNVLWLMPVQPVGKLRSAGGLGSPYAVADFDAVNPELGTQAEFRRLIRAAHERKIAVIIDWVVNHTAWDNPWIKSHPEWYQQDASGKIIIPQGTNWQDVAALNFKSEAMRGAMIDSMVGWVKRYPIDGFRCDSADFQPFDFWKQAIPRLRAASPKMLLMLAEGTRLDHYDAGFDLLYGWDFMYKFHEVYKGGPATELAKAAAREDASSTASRGRLRFTTNHDESAWNGTTLEFFKTAQGIQTAFLVTALSGGVPMIYSGEEVSWPKRIPIFERTSVDWTAHPETSRWMAKIVNLRARNLALRRGIRTDASSQDTILFWKTLTSDQAMVIANPRDHATQAPIPMSQIGAWHDALDGSSVALGETLELPAYGARVLVRSMP